MPAAGRASSRTRSLSRLRSRKPLLLAMATCVIVALAGGAAVAARTVLRPAPARFPMAGPSSGSTSTPPAKPLTFPGDWKVAAHSQAGYRVREKLARLPAPSDAVGRTSKVSGTMSLAKSGDGYLARHIRVVVGTASLKSDQS